jgi:chaperonin GroES
MPILQPLGDKVIVEAIEEDDKLDSGLYIPDTAKDKPQRGKVLAVGPGRLGLEGKRMVIPLEENDEVLFAKYAGSTFKFSPDDPNSFILLSDEDIIAKINYTKEELNAAREG